jgi:hypothetical protein
VELLAPALTPERESLARLTATALYGPYTCPSDLTSLAAA